jgi:hypothetical protein
VGRLIRLWRALGVVGLAAIAISACGGQGHVVATRASGSATPSSSAADQIQLGKVVYQGDFADPSQGWPTRSDANQSLSVIGSNYIIERKTAGAAVAGPNFAGIPDADLVHVAVSTTVQLTKATAGDGVGVFCRSIQGHSYVFAVGPTSQTGQWHWSISRHDSNRTTTSLGSGTMASPNQPFGIEGDCVGGQHHSPVLLVLSVGGQRIGQGSDAKIASPFFGLSGLSVSSASGGTSATFSSFQVRAASVM